MDTENLRTTAVEFVRHNQGWAPFIVAALAFGESLAFMSLLFPATVLLVAIGAAIGGLGLSFWPIWLGGAIGGPGDEGSHMLASTASAMELAASSGVMSEFTNSVMTSIMAPRMDWGTVML